jgi:type II secretory pathway component PulK
VSLRVVFDTTGEVAEYELGYEIQDAEFQAAFRKASMLALDVETCAALLLGEDVPDDHLDTEWVERFGRHS